MIVRLLQGDCLARMAEMPEGSVPVVCCDPPYGLEFMGKEWDTLGRASWESGGGFSKPGIGHRDIQWPSFSATGQFGAANPTCAVCGGRLRGAKKCSCSMPHDHWKPIGKRRKGREAHPAESLDRNGVLIQQGAIRRAVRGTQTAWKRPEWESSKAPKFSSNAPAFDLSVESNHRMQEWHQAWLTEVFRVLQPGGTIKVFGGTRTFHRLTAAMETAGFIDIGFESWAYGSGFPKSWNVGKFIEALERTGGTSPRQQAEARAMTGQEQLAVGDVRHQFDREEWQGTKSGQYRNVPGSQWEVTTERARAWAGWGTALKPGWEPILVGRKPS